VLLADDVDLLRGMLRDLLESMNIQVLEASNAAAAIRIGRSHSGKIDLLLTDIEMGGKPGWEFANEIAREQARHPCSLHVRRNQSAGMGWLQGKVGWQLFYSKAISVGGIESALDGHLRGVKKAD
jgi:CheY-like chemotaxis protein